MSLFFALRRISFALLLLHSSLGHSGSCLQTPKYCHSHSSFISSNRFFSVASETASPSTFIPASRASTRIGDRQLQVLFFCHRFGLEIFHNIPPCYHRLSAPSGLQPSHQSFLSSFVVAVLPLISIKLAPELGNVFLNSSRPALPLNHSHTFCRFGN